MPCEEAPKDHRQAPIDHPDDGADRAQEHEGKIGEDGRQTNEDQVVPSGIFESGPEGEDPDKHDEQEDSGPEGNQA